MMNWMRSKRRDGEEYWISVSDLMAGLMMVFLFIMIIYTRDSDEKLHITQEIIAEWRATEQEIYLALEDEFEDDLPRWNAIIERETLTLRFLSPDILFETGKAEIRTEFKAILDDFIPRYMKLLEGQFADSVSEIRIEGHTSSEWKDSVGTLEAFIKNMDLSQERTRSVMEYSLNLQEIQNLTPWMIKTVSANGMSSARLILDDAGVEEKHLSKRVEFRIRTKTQEVISEIIEKIAPGVRKAF